MPADHDPRRPETLRRRQQDLRVRSAELRFRIGRDASRLAPSLVVVDRGLAGLRWLRDNPAWPLGAAALVIALRPRRALRWATRLWWSWRAARSARAWLERRR